MKDKIVRVHLIIQTIILVFVCAVTVLTFLIVSKTTATLDTPDVTIPSVTTENIPETTAEIIIPETTESTPEVTDASISEETISAVDPNDLELLACVIYQEAGADYCCDDCRRRVADVVLNRVASPYFPDTIHGVLTAKGQYGRFYWTGVIWPDNAGYSSEAHAVERAYRIAEEVLSGRHSDLYGNGYIWQAEFVQGTDGFWCCGIYFGR